MLDAPRAAFQRWMEGEESMPVAYLGMVFDFLADMESGATAINAPKASAGVRAP